MSQQEIGLALSNEIPATHNTICCMMVKVRGIINGTIQWQRRPSFEVE
jgi:hypothetical protein